jgi:hypothetical protein
LRILFQVKYIYIYVYGEREREREREREAILYVLYSERTWYWKWMKHGSWYYLIQIIEFMDVSEVFEDIASA